MLVASEGGFRMTSAAASCPSATRALSTERARRTRFASCRACAGCELAAGLIALIDASRFVVGTARLEPLCLVATADTTARAPLSQPSTVSWTGARREERGPERFGLEGWPAMRLREQQIWSRKYPRMDSPWHRPRGQNQGARLVHTQVDATLASSTVPTQPSVRVMRSVGLKVGIAVTSGSARASQPHGPTQSAATT